MKSSVSGGDDLLDLLRRLAVAGVEFVLIGASAAAAHGVDLATKDIDIVASLTDDNARRIIEALQSVNPRWLTRPDLPVIRPESHHLHRLKNMYIRTDIGRLDVLGELPGICSYEELLTRSVEMDFGGVRCRVVDIDTLIAAKRHANREHDRITVKHLEALKKEREHGQG